MKRLKLPNDAGLMEAIAKAMLSDVQVLEALMPGSTGSDVTPPPAQQKAISIRGLTPGVAYDLGQCCHPVPGDRIVGLRREGEPIMVHAIDCPVLASGVDADWIDLAWGDGSDGAAAQLVVILKNEPGTLGAMASIFGAHSANILNLKLETRDASFHGFRVDLEVHDLAHLMRILAALRAADAVSSAERA